MTPYEILKQELETYKKTQDEHDCGDTNCDGLPDFPLHVNRIADMIDPREAQIAVARAMVTMGSLERWDSETIEWVAEPMLAIGKRVGLPTFTDSSDHRAFEFWQSVES